MNARYLATLLVLLVLMLPAAPAQAAGVVGTCDQANLLAALSGGGTVTFACSGTITLSGTITISSDTTIDGSGQVVTISGGNSVPLFQVSPGIAFHVVRLTLANGYVGSDGGAIYNDGGTVTVTYSTLSGNRATNGGALFNQGGTLTVSSSTFSDNSGSGDGGAIAVYEGTLSVSKSTFSNNSADLGGAIANYADATVSNSTFTGNHGDSGGGGIFGWGGSTVIMNSTLSGNSAPFDGSNIFHLTGSLGMANTIVANGSGTINCNFSVTTLTNNGGNLSWPDTSCPGSNANPLLGALQDNGGPTFTMAPGGGSAAIDAGNDAVCAAAPVNNRDQRNGVRPVGAHCDSGAYEVGATPMGILLDSFGAAAAPDEILLAWTTTSELDNTGFNLWRATSADGSPIRLNDALIPSQGPGSSQGFSYTWRDRAGLVSGTTYYYWLEDVDVNGVATRHGPVSATYLLPTAVALGSLGASGAPAGLPLAAPAGLLLAAGGVAWYVRRRA